MHELTELLGTAIFRIFVIALATGLGFLAGWLLSPQSKGFRKIILYIFAGLFLIAALFFKGFLGWQAAILLATAGFMFGASYWLTGALKSVFRMPDTFGSSRWATKDDVKDHKLYGTEGIRIGKVLDDADEPEWISYKGERHLMTVAPTRSGKGTTQIIPNLLTYEGSMLVIDPKGENAIISAKRRKELGQEVYVVDPWGITDIEGVERASFNPLDWLNKWDNDITENSMILADALIVAENHQAL